MRTSLSRLAAPRIEPQRACLHAVPLSPKPHQTGGGSGSGGGAPVYEVALQFDIPHALPLWQAAAQRLRDHGLDMADIAATIGSSDHPSIEDCLETLLLPRQADGCDLVDFDVRPGRSEDAFPPSFD